MSERTNKFLKDFKKSSYNSNATEDIVNNLVKLEEEKNNIENNDIYINKEETATIEEIKIETTPKEPVKKEAKKSNKKAESKSKAGRKPFKNGDYKKITIDIPLELYDAMQDFIGAFDNNMTAYIKKALTDDINENYNEYVKKAQASKENKPVLTIKRK